MIAADVALRLAGCDLDPLPVWPESAKALPSDFHMYELHCDTLMQ
ncbi:hypothetical protein SALB1_3077 [Salinisphaera sp. LB1]|nr:hypothetical protein SALB1_3077 [Salinisphaera sp. LB1]